MLRLSSSSSANICCCRAEVGVADSPGGVDDTGGDGELGGALCFSNITFEWEIFRRNGCESILDRISWSSVARGSVVGKIC